MKSREIVRKAWQMTQVHIKKLIWYGAVPAFFSFVFSSAYLTYQYEAFKSSQLFSGQSEEHLVSTARLVWNLALSHPWFFIVAIVAVVLFLAGRMILPPVFHGTLIQAVMKINEFQPIEGSFMVGLRRFFPMFEYSLLTGAFSITTLFTESSFVLRWWGESVLFFLLPVLIFVAIIGFLLSFLFTYAEYFIVLKKMSIINAIKESALLVITNLKKTILVFVLMLLIGARIVLNVLLILLIPMILIVLSTFFATQFFTLTGFIVIGVVGLLITLLASYLLGLFQVFSTAVWVITFDVLAGKEKMAIHDEDVGHEHASHEGGHEDTRAEVHGVHH